MRHSTKVLWIVMIAWLCTSIALVGARVLETTPTSAPNVDRTGILLPVIHTQADSGPSPQLEATIAALIAQNAQQATANAQQAAQQATMIANQNSYISYLFTQVPAQNRVTTVDALVLQGNYNATNVAALYQALGSPIPTTPPSPTFGPSPFPTSTAYVTSTPSVTVTPANTATP